MMGNGRLLLCLTLWLCSVSVIKSDILPWSPDEGDVPLHDILVSLDHLQETLLDHSDCDDRLEKMWDTVGHRREIFEDLLSKTTQILDHWSQAVSITKEECSGAFKKRKGNICFHIYDSNKWMWWRSRAYCWLQGEEIVTPRNLRFLKAIIPKSRDYKFWIGARTSAELEFPDWFAVDGERVSPLNNTFTTFPRPSAKANCLALDESNNFVPLECEEKHVTVCQQMLTLPACEPPFEMVGRQCLQLHQTTSVSWEEAKEICEAAESQLPSPDDYDIMHEHLSNKFGSDDWKTWTGGKMNESSSVLQWEDETEVGPLSWRHNDESTGDCLALQGGEFSSSKMDCDSHASVLCQKY